MSIEELIHPDDTKALKVLMNIPALPQVMEKVFEYGYDEISWTENLTTNLRLSETQMPEIYNRLPPICERLGIPVPELYLQMSNIANSWTSGRKKVYIVLTLGLIRRVKGDALDAVLLMSAVIFFVSMYCIRHLLMQSSHLENLSLIHLLVWLAMLL